MCFLDQVPEAHRKLMPCPGGGTGSSPEAYNYPCTEDGPRGCLGFGDVLGGGTGSSVEAQRGIWEGGKGHDPGPKSPKTGSKQTAPLWVWLPPKFPLELQAFPLKFSDLSLESERGESGYLACVLLYRRQRIQVLRNLSVSRKGRSIDLLTWRLHEEQIDFALV